MQRSHSGFTLGEDVRIDVSNAGAWIVVAKNGTFPLEETRDFFRVWLLLEHPFADVKNSLSRLEIEKSAHTEFRLKEVVRSALQSESRQWTERAMEWVPLLSMIEKKSLQDNLTDVAGSKWATQKSRQIASKFLKEIGRNEQH